MIDLIKCVKDSLSCYEVAEMVERNSLSRDSEAGKACYSNKRMKNLKQSDGIFINIDTGGKLKFEGSIHKYYNVKEVEERQNTTM